MTGEYKTVLCIRDIKIPDLQHIKITPAYMPLAVSSLKLTLFPSV